MIPFWDYCDEKESDSDFPKVVFKYILSYQDVPIIHSSKKNELLKLMGRKLEKTNPFQLTNISATEMYKLKIHDERELYEWLLSLRNDGLVEFSEFLEGIDKRHMSLSAYLTNDKLISLTPLG